MRILPPERRDAMFAIYAFCREVDDIADGDASDDIKRRDLQQWRDEIDSIYDPDRSPTLITARALVAPTEAFGMARDDYIAVIDGMEMDVGTGIRAPSMETLQQYCDRVAGAVGLLSIRAFGAQEERAKDFAIALGSALQFTNILRDLREDAEIDRLYLPRELLQEHGIESTDPNEVLDHPALPAVCHDLAKRAELRFQDAENALADCAREPLRPAIVMMMSYRQILGKLLEGGWRNIDDQITISKPLKLWTAIRYGFF